jgi:hypothetical protein
MGTWWSLREAVLVDNVGFIVQNVAVKDLREGDRVTERHATST